MPPHMSEAAPKDGPDVQLPGEHLDSTPARQTAQRGWRDKIKVHPAADLFPMAGGDELQAMADDIKKNGLREKVILWRPSNRDEDGTTHVLLDGRNRLTAMEMAGIDPFTGNGGTLDDRFARRVIGESYGLGMGTMKRKAQPSPWRGQGSSGIWVGDPYEFVISANIHRRHLTREQRRGLVAELLKAQPEKSNRQIAKQAKVDHKTVAAVRGASEGTGEIPQLDKTVGKDGKARPARKPGARALVQEERDRRVAALEAAADLIVQRLDDDDLDRLVELLDVGIALPGWFLLEARERGGAS